MTDLFSKTSIGRLNVRNHFIRSATMEGKAAEDGRPTEAIEEMYVNLAKGGVGTIITSYTYISDYEQPQKYELGIYKNEMIPAYRVITDRVHEAGGRIIMQLVHGSSLSQGYPEKAKILGPSAIPNPRSGMTPKEMTIDDIHHVESLFALAAERAKKAGFDGVEIHAAHGYLLAQFMSPLLNRRTDAYGGSAENRFRIVRETYKAIREKTGEKYPIWIKINSSDEEPGGLTEDEFIQMGRWLSQDGIDAIEVSGEKWYTHGRNERLYYLKPAAELQALVQTPVILTGGVRSREDLEKGQQEGIQFFGFARPLLQNPDFLNTLRGRLEIRPIRQDEVPLLSDFIYEAIYTPKGYTRPSKDIVNTPEMQVYVRDFGKRPEDIGLVAVMTDRVVGAVWARIMNDYGHIDDHTPSLALALVPGVRGRGIWTALMKSMFTELKGRGYDTVSLSVQKSNPAKHLYDRLGFIQVGSVMGETEEEIVMKKDLKEATE
jgi:2,4-dienoyl-CoA reductase-like NADH-dependent reductase (Old Yellow Enzyme family)/ribosomal protein S18 acetylase RimI-like enzyme